jgi:RNA polymerase sigma-70 factor (ECF subfamily)
MSLSTTNDGSSLPARQWFTTTHWSVVLRAADTSGPGAQAALEQLCRTYWYPLYAYVRRQGHSAEDAQDLTQEFFARFLAKKHFQLANRDRGRFRSFLLTTLKHFLVNEWERSTAQKRGGLNPKVPVDTVTGEELYNHDLSHGLTADKIYERNWALAMLKRVHDRLQRDYADAGKAERFVQLEQFLPGEKSDMTYAEAAARLGLPEGTVKSEVSRLKKRYGELLRSEIAHTVSSPDEIKDELRYLITVVGDGL